MLFLFIISLFSLAHHVALSHIQQHFNHPFLMKPPGTSPLTYAMVSQHIKYGTSHSALHASRKWMDSGRMAVGTATILSMAHVNVAQIYASHSETCHLALTKVLGRQVKLKLSSQPFF